MGDRMSALTERETAVLAAVIDSFVRTAAPAGSRRIGKEYELGVSAATIRNTMADLESKGFLSHPHTSAGRVPTDLAYRYYVDGLMRWGQPGAADQAKIEREFAGLEVAAVEELVARAARVLSLLTGELGLAVGPTLGLATLERLEFVPVSSEKALLEIRKTMRERLQDLRFDDAHADELVNIFVHSGPDVFEWALQEREVHLGSAAVLAEQPEFLTGERLRELILLTERRDLLATVLGDRHGAGPKITIGGENGQPELDDLTIVTANYSVGSLQGTVGVIGPTRMPYDKVVSIVDWTSGLLSRLARF